MELEISFGKLVREHRLSLGLTQAELSIRVGCATITVRKIEADTLRPSVQIAERLAMALDIPLPKCIFAHGFWTSEGRKMSKSLGNFVSREVILDICREYSADVFRYYLLRAANFGQDANFSAETLKEKYNNELANGIGNLLSRVTNMVDRYFGGDVPQPGDAGEQEQPVRDAADELRLDAPRVMEICAFHSYLDKLQALATATNVYIDRTEPFKLAKDPSQAGRLGTILYTCVEAVRVILVYLEPVMPTVAAAGMNRIGWKCDDLPLTDSAKWGAIRPGTKTSKGDALFPRKE